MARFAAGAGSTVTDARFEFTNEDSVDTGGNDEIQICAEGTADYSITAEGGELHYQWKKDGLNISEDLPNFSIKIDQFHTVG